ncbi:hypothetical protein G5S_0837 [Chlamydia pecorum E58]|uniref:Uncharacterized protein n=1 Tax=Chlamydia pecorum (strain ATCC VR-628 / DSM 29919 / E58) TaxID=331635 RepID=A0AA34RDL4_CHLPE|nr:hypothetical protein G5S_0837 [Chlamydia pecorum E58]
MESTTTHPSFTLFDPNEVEEVISNKVEKRRTALFRMVFPENLPW